ncbi:hypothetical protein KP751_00715 [Streptococcus equi subsp. equi]|nr:hypothetical protein [Streptococcus equi subsp. equi]
MSEYVGQVKFVDFGWNIVDKADTHEPFYNYKDGCPDEIREIEVIGNIYQNSELLESVENDSKELIEKLQEYPDYLTVELVLEDVDLVKLHTKLIMCLVRIS